jgi:hypothetical protein
MEVNDIGYTYGLALVWGTEKFRVILLDYIRIKIGNDHFDSHGLSL